MIIFHSFNFSGDTFFEKPVRVQLSTPGLTFMRGINYDGMVDGVDSATMKDLLSNGAGKTRFFQLLEGFIYGRNERALNFKKFASSDFEGELDFENTISKTRWQFRYSVKEGWTVMKNGDFHFISHQPSTVQAALEKEIGFSRDEWGHYLYICHESLRILISGKPKERREYLESFFSIDTYYQEKYDEYYDDLVALQVKMERVQMDKTRLHELEDILANGSGQEWLDHQLLLSDEAIQFLRKSLMANMDSVAILNSQKADWKQFSELSGNVDVSQLPFLSERRDRLISELQMLTQKFKDQKSLSDWVDSKLKPHLAKRPEAPEQPSESKPDQTALIELSKSLSEMREKSKLREEMLSLREDLKALEDVASIDREKLALDQERANEEIANLRHRLAVFDKLTSCDGGICPTCNQSIESAVAEVASGQTRDEISDALSNARSKLIEFKHLLNKIDRFESKHKEFSFLKERYDRFPVFGISLEAATAEYKKQTELSQAWSDFEKMNSITAAWEEQTNLYKAHFNALGGRDLLSEEIESEVSKKRDDLSTLRTEINRVEQFSGLYERIKTYPSLKQIEDSLYEMESFSALYEERITSLFEESSRWRLERSQVHAAATEAETLKDRVAGFDATQNEYSIGKTLTDFYSPKGFKLFELKARCKEFVDRCNYWSKVFFQEPYEWSVSDDVENMNFYVKPLRGKAEPYPIGGLSNGEKNRAARVLCFAQLDMIPPAKRTNLLVLDEVEAFLDQAGTKAYVYQVLETLKTSFPQLSIIVVSHIAALINSDHIDHLWVVERRNRKSSLTAYPFYTKKKYSIKESADAVL